MTRLMPVLASFGVLVLLAGATPQMADSPEELIRRANAAYAARNLDEADRLYHAAEERTGDPGLIAFNRAAVLFANDEFREAELHYVRVLEDAACPPERAARAWYNRGTCLLRRGTSPAVYRSAIACFEHCLESPAADAPLQADARHNLELAKLLWNESRKSAAKTDSPNENPPLEEQDPRHIPPRSPSASPEPGVTDPADANAGGSSPQTVPQPITHPLTGPKSGTTQQPNQGGGAQNLQPLANAPQLQVLTPEDTREYLRRAAERIKKDRQDLWRTLYGKVPPGVRDW